MRFQTSTVVNRPQEAVFECVSSAEFIQEWIAPIRSGRHGISYENGHFRIIHTTPRIKKIAQMTEGPLMKGTVFTQDGGMGESFLESTIEVIEHEYPNALAFQITSRLIAAQTKYIFEQATDGTRLTMLADIQFQGCWMNLIGLLSILLNRNAPQKYGLQVKQYIEEHC